MNDTDRALAALAARVRHLETLEYQDAANVYPVQATMWMDEVVVVSGNTPIYEMLGAPISLQAYYHAVFQPFPWSNGDSVEVGFHLAAGTYTLYALGWTGNSFGIIDWSVDGVVVGTQDWYSVAATYSVVQSTANVVVPTSGNHTLRLTINGKNAGSSSYRWGLSKIWLQ